MQENMYLNQIIILTVNSQALASIRSLHSRIRKMYHLCVKKVQLQDLKSDTLTNPTC